MPLATLALASARAAAAPAPGKRPTALLLFTDAGEPALRASGLTPGIVSAAQGVYSRAQLLLDLTQGSRVATSQYGAPAPPPLTLECGRGAPVAPRRGCAIGGWQAARARAAAAPAALEPGLLAGRVPGGAAYVGSGAGSHIDAVAAAGRDGAVAAVSLGPPATVPERVDAMTGSHALVVADLAPGRLGARQLAALVTARPRAELIIALQRAPDGATGDLLWGGAAGLPSSPAGLPGDGALTSGSTAERGLIAAIDVAPTILAHVDAGGGDLPSAVVGSVIRTGGPASAPLQTLMRRLREIPGRRLPALAVLLCAWALLLAAARGRRMRVRAARAGAIGVLWAPAVSLVTAAAAPSAPVEYAAIAVGALALGAATDALLPSPRALFAPALATVALLAADALLGSELLIRSLAGPDPLGGARFHGIGNELKSGLAVLVLAACAAAVRGRPRSVRAAALFAWAGAGLALLEGSPQLGAGVGGVVIVAAAFTAASALLLPPGSGLRELVPVLCAPLALAALLGLDLALGHPHGVLHARTGAELGDVLRRRYGAALAVLLEPGMAAATVAALLACLLGFRARGRLLAPRPSADAPGERDPALAALFAGGLAAGVVGTLVEDSGPLLLVEAVAVLACVACYLYAGLAVLSERRSPTAKAQVSTATSELAATPPPTIAVLGGSEGTA